MAIERVTTLPTLPKRSGRTATRELRYGPGGWRGWRALGWPARRAWSAALGLAFKGGTGPHRLLGGGAADGRRLRAFQLHDLSPGVRRRGPDPVRPEPQDDRGNSWNGPTCSPSGRASASRSEAPRGWSTGSSRVGQGADDPRRRLALNLLAGQTHYLANLERPDDLDHHPGEFARLTGRSIAEITGNRPASGPPPRWRRPIIWSSS